MNLGDWDYLVVAGVILIVAGLWLVGGPGAALIALGAALMLAGVGGAMGR